MSRLVGPVLKSLVFVVVTVLATTELALTISNGSTGGRGYAAVFGDATSLNVGDDVRMAGVRVGQVTGVAVTHRRLARVSFLLSGDVRLARTVTATIRYRNLVGQRYVALDEGSGALTDPLPPGAVIPLARTRPALDLTQLFDGFQPLFAALDARQVNQLSAEIIAVFQGEGSTVDDLLTSTASLTATLADRATVIRRVIDNLDSVLRVVTEHGGQLRSVIVTLSELVRGLAADRAPLGSAIEHIDGLAAQVTGLLQRGRSSIHDSISGLGAVSGTLAGSAGALNSFLQNLPGKLAALGRTGSYGSWLNFYLCSVSGRIPVPGDYYGDAGVQPTAGRCSP